MKKIWTLFLVLLSAFSSLATARTRPDEHKLITGRHFIYQTGLASWYGDHEAGRLTADGERFNPWGMTCAHRLLPIGTLVRVTNLGNGRSVVLRVNDRGPYVAPRIIDLSLGAARQLGCVDTGVIRVSVEVLVLGHGGYLHPGL